jgi:hypothetical protein
VHSRHVMRAKCEVVIAVMKSAVAWEIRPCSAA